MTGIIRENNLLGEIKAGGRDLLFQKVQLHLELRPIQNHSTGPLDTILQKNFLDFATQAVLGSSILQPDVPPAITQYGFNQEIQPFNRYTWNPQPYARPCAMVTDDDRLAKAPGQDGKEVDESE